VNGGSPHILLRLAESSRTNKAGLPNALFLDRWGKSIEQGVIVCSDILFVNQELSLKQFLLKKGYAIQASYEIELFDFYSRLEPSQVYSPYPKTALECPPPTPSEMDKVGHSSKLNPEEIEAFQREIEKYAYISKISSQEFLFTDLACKKEYIQRLVIATSILQKTTQEGKELIILEDNNSSWSSWLGSYYSSPL
jgi:hypothetical protein